MKPSELYKAHRGDSLGDFAGVERGLRGLGRAGCDAALNEGQFIGINDAASLLELNICLRAQSDVVLIFTSRGSWTRTDWLSRMLHHRAPVLLFAKRIAIGA